MTSPLKHFTNAKKKINNIFSDITHYIKEFEEFLDDTNKSDENDVINEELEDEVSASLEKVTGIKDIVSRNHMKVVFFGRTSNGKSTVINAMLWDKILPSGIGHTTNCFLSIAGCNEDKNTFDDTGYLLCSDSDERRNVKSVTQLSHALSQESMSSESLIQIFWPKRKCALLKDEVVLLDSPGIDVSSDLDRWIDNYCLDADVFILVANAESTLMLAEKKFFHRVNEKLSKPNIFILNNRWDASASEPDLMQEVRQQHLERGVSFLADELKVVTKQQARDRVFFVSAKETLQSRMQKLLGKPEGTTYMADGHQARLMEFNQFEQEFERCISQTATRTKFEQHCHRASKIIDSLYNRAQWLHARASEVMKESDNRRKFLESRLEYIDYQMKVITERCRKSISSLADEAERQVRVAMTEEIKRLPSLVDEFQRPFHPNAMVLRVYKAELYRHVEDGLGRNLSARCSISLQKEIDKNRGEMIKVIGPLLLPPSSCSQNETIDADSTSVDVETCLTSKDISPSTNFFRSLMRSTSQEPSFDMSYDIDCASLCADFQEDIEFKFSLGFQQLIARFIGPKQARRVRLRGITPDAPAPPSPQRTSTSHPGLPPNHIGVHGLVDPVPTDELLWSLASGYVNFTQGHSSVVVAFLGLLPWMLWRTIGWRAVAFSFASYGALYAYERVTWTSRAKEKAVKRQFVEHATDKLNLVITFTSSNCSHQVQQELSGTFTKLCSDVESVREEIREEIEALVEKSRNLAKVHTRSKTLRNKAGWLASELDNFARRYLTPPSSAGVSAPTFSNVNSTG